MPDPWNFPFAYRQPTDIPSQIRVTREPRAEHSSRPRIAAVALVLGVVGGLGLMANLPEDAQVLTTPYCVPSSGTGIGQVPGDEALVC